MNQKIWGETCEIFRNDTVSVNLLKIKKGGVCSWHFHNSKYNRFHVVSGRIVIRFQYPDCSLSTCAVEEGESHGDIPPRVLHEFEGLEDSVVIETTFVKNDPDDITRVTRVRAGHLRLR
jgi:quercetin dioxygenase-like cupin family protein